MAISLGMPKDGKLIALDINKEWTSLAKEMWTRAGVDNKIELYLDGGMAGLDMLINDKSNHKTFDFAYIDAVKSDNIEYFERLMVLMRKDGVIAFDNVLRGCRVPDFNDNDDMVVAVRGFNEYMVNDNRIEMCMLGWADGVTLLNVK